MSHILSHKRKGLSLSSTPRRDSSVCLSDRSTSSNQNHNYMIETQRTKPTQPLTITFNYLNPVSSSAKLEQVVKYEQRRSLVRPRQEIVQREKARQVLPVRRMYFQERKDENSGRGENVQEKKLVVQQKYQVISPTPVTQNLNLQSQYATELLLQQKLEQKERQLKELQLLNDKQQSQIQNLHQLIRAAEDKYKSFDQQAQNVKAKQIRSKQQQTLQKQKLKSMVMQVQRTHIQCSKQKCTQRRRLNPAKMQQIQAKLNRLMSQIKQ